jgi:hypothetical protein
MISREEWLRIPLEARLVEHASHTEDELLREDLLQAVKKIDKFAQTVADQATEIVRLERLSHVVTPY